MLLPDRALLCRCCIACEGWPVPRKTLLLGREELLILMDMCLYKFWAYCTADVAKGLVGHLYPSEEHINIISLVDDASKRFGNGSGFLTKGIFKLGNRRQPV